LGDELSARAQIAFIVGIVALVAGGSVVGVTLATRQTPEQPQAQKSKPPIGKVLPTPAADQIRAAFAEWPKGTTRDMERLGREYPKDPVVQLYRGIALYWAGYIPDGETVLRKTKKVGADTQWRIQADNILHPEFLVGYPTFQPTEPNLLLEKGSRLQQEGHQLSARTTFEQAVRKAPTACEPRVAVAVSYFDKDNLNASFSRLGPLGQQFPKCQSVRYYLALLLGWTGQREAAVTQFKKTVALGPNTALGKGAAQFLANVQGQGGTTPTTK
jgi:tetratricopeptide (TPR) repeat protein